MDDDGCGAAEDDGDGDGDANVLGGDGGGGVIGNRIMELLKKKTNHEMEEKTRLK